MTKWTKKYLSVLFYFEQCRSWQAWGLCPTFIATAQQGYVHWIMQWDSRRENNKLLKLSVSKVILQSAGKVTERNLSKRTFFQTYISHDTDITDYLLWLGLGVKKYAQANKNCVFKTHNFDLVVHTRWSTRSHVLIDMLLSLGSCPSYIQVNMEFERSSVVDQSIHTLVMLHSGKVEQDKGICQWVANNFDYNEDTITRSGHDSTHVMGIITCQTPGISDNHVQVTRYKV